MIKEPDDLVIPGGLFKAFEELRVPAGLVVEDYDGFEIFFDGFDERRMGEDFGPKDLAATSSWNLLEENENRLFAFF